MQLIKTFIATALLQIHGISWHSAYSKVSAYFDNPNDALVAAYIFALKLYGCAKLAIPFSALGFLYNNLRAWGLSNSDYIAGVMACIAVDHIIGSIYHLRQRDFTLKRNAIGLVTKIGLCAAAALMFEVIHHATKTAPLVYDYLKAITRLIVLFYPAGSAFMNMSALTGGVFPPIGWIKKLKDFNADLDLDRFKKNNE